MPTKSELVSNRPLAGHELAKIILADLADVLARDSMLSSHVAYGRVAYDLRVTLHLDNPAYPEHRSRVASQPRSDNEIAADPSLAVIQPAPPLTAPSDDAFASATERRREIASPNLARLENGLPITVVSSTAEGHSAERQVVYPPSVAEGSGTPPIDADVTAIVKGEWAAVAGGRR